MEEVKTTRQELLRLKKYLAQVKNAKKLLEEKRDTLVEEFLKLKREFVKKKEELFEKTREVISLVEFSVKYNPISKIDFISSKPRANFELESTTFFTMGVKSKMFKIKNFHFEEIDKEICPKSFFDAILKFKEIFPQFIELASLENTLNKLANAIKKTRRRVNYLKEIVIPNLEQKVKYLTQRLSDQERESFVFNLKFKSKISAKSLAT
jgi:V/A-type H+-transporting ATPase subunit D